MFESIITTTETTISAGTAILTIAAALCMGVIIAVCYMLTQKKGSYTRDFVIAVAILPAIVAAVIILIGSSVARALSLAGAFALVRFRSAPGSGKDIAVVFFTMAVGLSCGLGYIIFALVFGAIIIAALFILCKTGFGSTKGNRKLLKITIPENLNYEGLFDDLFSEYAKETCLKNVKTTNMGTLYELTYHIVMKNDVSEKEFIDSIRCRNGNLNISLGMIPDKSELIL
ncbi:MAG: DUF4956 domain-containing protein [Butyrivibrio sp.]